ncbi:TBC1 domain family member 15 [Taenia solium]|eukprot:TsM_000378400 transcript=TsM_000378400 gene=TsM_000378400
MADAGGSPWEVSEAKVKKGDQCNTTFVRTSGFGYLGDHIALNACLFHWISAYGALPDLMALSEVACDKWCHVNFTADIESVCGTLFLLSPNSEDTIIQWIADSDTLPERQASPKIPLSSISQVERRRLLFNRHCTSIFFRTSRNEIFGPFEFTQGGSTNFIEKLRLYVDMQRISSDPEVYKITRKASTYQLPTSDFSSSPMSVIHGVGTRLMSVFEGLRVSADAALNGAGIYDGTASWRRSPNSEGFLDPDLVAQRIMMNQIYTDQLHLNEPLTSITAPDDADYQLISCAPLPISIPDLRPVPRKHPVSLEMWQRHLDHDGRVTVAEKLQTYIYNGGIEPDLRPIAWKYLFGYLKWDFTKDENAKRVQGKHQHYQIMKTFWRSMSPKQVRNSCAFRERKSIIEKDTYRTDRQTALFRDNSAGALTRLYNILMTYTFYNPDLGYFQGMNDLLAVIMSVIDGEEDAFWCFAGLLDRVSGHFSNDSLSLSSQFVGLFKLIEILMPRFARFLREKEATSMSFCFRWFLIIFKREFSYDDIKILWETLFSGAAPKNFQLLIAVAIFDSEADTIIRNCSDISQILQHINGLSERINLQNVLSRAQGIYHQLLEVKDRLPNDVAVCLGFALPAATSGGVATSASSDACHDNEGDFLPVIEDCGFGLEPTAASPPSSSHSDLEVGEDIVMSGQRGVNSVAKKGSDCLS